MTRRANFHNTAAINLSGPPPLTHPCQQYEHCTHRPQHQWAGRKRKRASPSKIKRDALRARLHAEKKKETSNGTHNPHAAESQTPRVPADASRRKMRLASLINLRKGLSCCSSTPDHSTSATRKAQGYTKEAQPTSPEPESRPITPAKNLYDGIESSMQLTRLEDSKNLMAALRLITRTAHPRGASINYPFPEAHDRIQLGTVGLPSDAEKLLRLTKDLVSSYGRNAFDPRKSCPKCHYTTRLP
ncbi:hypothetical protein HUJ04_001431 [Dendroctonus ponderosae]|nr:hypothetical protein HUJ04_001431 [Dendroctonus ponderosae]